MFKNYFTITFRYLLKHKVFSLINIVGLSTSITCFLLILQYVHFELSYDNFHTYASDIYRVPFDWGETDDTGEKNSIYASNVPAFGPAVKSELPEVAAYTRLLDVLTFTSQCMFSYQKPNRELVTFHEEEGYYTDASFLTMFSFPLLYGDPTSALAAPNTIVLTETLADKYFGSSWREDNPIGQMIQIHNGSERQYEVTGILEDIPENSHLQFNFLLSYESLPTNAAQNSWYMSLIYTYLQLTPGADPKTVEAKLPAFIRKYTGEESEISMFLQPLQEVYFGSHLHLRNEAGSVGSKTTVYFLLAIGFLILCIAWINYVNLNTAQSVGRAREVGVRKVLGSSQKQLVVQFLSESITLHMVSLCIAIILVVLLQNVFQSWTDKDILLPFWQQTAFWLILLAFITIGPLLAGFYPAFVQSSFNPVHALKSKIKMSRKASLREGLVIFQFAASLILLTGTIAVYQQLSFMQKQNLGMNTAQTLIIKAPGMIDAAYSHTIHAFKNTLLQQPSISAVTASSAIPGKEITTTGGVKKANGYPKGGNNVFVVQVDSNYVKAYGIDIIAGRDFADELSSDSKAVLINEATVLLLAFENNEAALNQTIFWQGNVEMKVVGVIKNYHQKSLREDFEPIILQYDPTPKGYYAVSITPQNLPETIAFVERAFANAFPSNAFDYFFLDDFFNRQYQADQRFRKIFSLFAGIAILIACVGLFGLASYTTAQRTKEIGIRKVLGASLPSILLLLTKGYLKLILIATIVAIPLANYLILEWLQNFSFKIKVTVWLFALPSLLVLLIALCSVSRQTFRAGRQNPVDSLKYE